MQKAKYKVDHEDQGGVYRKDECYPITEETRRHIDLNLADEVTVPDEDEAAVATFPLHGADV